MTTDPVTDDRGGSPAPVCIITGASGTIGSATTRLLAERGCIVYAGVRSTTASSPPTFQPPCHSITLDVSSDTSVEAAVQEVLRREGRIDVVVNNAAIVEFGPIETTPVDRVAAMFDVNVLGPLRLTQAVAPAMRRARSGLVVQISSVSGRLVTPLSGAYAASKHALEAWSEAAWQEFGHFGVSVVVIEPGDVGSTRDAVSGGADLGPYEPLWQQVFADRGRGRAGRPSPQEVAEAVWAAIAQRNPDVLRVQVGSDARAALTARPATSDADFRDLAFAMLGADW